MAASDLVSFPDVSTADDDGLLFVGGRLTETWIMEGYRRGIFPWPLLAGRKSVLAWFSPDPRAVLELDRLHISRRLGRRLRSGRFEVTFDRSFADVIAGCAEPRRAGEASWITPALARAYQGLHARGVAHSVEVWQAGALAGGLYGVAHGGWFSGESMFSRERDASKIALVHLVERLRARGFELFDIQQMTPHMSRMGARSISRHDYLRRLSAAWCKEGRFSG